MELFKGEQVRGHIVFDLGGNVFGEQEGDFNPIIVNYYRNLFLLPLPNGTIVSTN